jgi:hypothetical protein
MDIGAAHTPRVHSTSRKKKSLICNLASLIKFRKSNGDLYTEVYNRKLNYPIPQSVDPAGYLGSFLDNRRKPTPVQNNDWIIEKAEIMYAGTIIARAAAGGGSPPFNLEKKTLGLASGLVDIDITAMQIAGNNPDPDGKRIIEVIFPIKLVKHNKNSWMRVGKYNFTSQNLIDTSENTLEQILLSMLEKVQNTDEITPDEAKVTETEHSTNNPGECLLSFDTRAIISPNRDAVIGY